MKYPITEATVREAFTAVCDSEDNKTPLELVTALLPLINEAYEAGHTSADAEELSAYRATGYSPDQCALFKSALALAIIDIVRMRYPKAEYAQMSQKFALRYLEQAQKDGEQA